MNDQGNQTSKKQSRTNFSIIQNTLKERWKEDKLAFILNKFFILFFLFIVLLIWQISSGIFDVFNQWLYSKSVQYIPRDTFTIVVGAIIAFGTVFYYQHKIYEIRYKPNLRFSLIVLFAGLFYFPVRWSQSWEFFPQWIGYIVIVDIYLLFLIGEIWAWINFLRIVHPAVIISDKSFGLDDPLANNDEFGRKDFAEEIGKYILGSFGDRSLAVGISGTWGSGKSYLLYQIQESIEVKKDHSIIQIRFNPWRSSTHNRIVEDFLQTLKAALGKYDTALSSKLDKYLKVLVEADKSNWIKTTLDLLDMGKELPSEELYISINEALGLLNKRLVIYIDDLDRLHKEEILEVFRIIRNTADFRNTCFIVAYDRDYIQNSFQSSNLQMSNYLDKIFQTEFVLPTVDPNILINIIMTEVLKRFENNKLLEQELKQVFNDNKKRIIILNTILHKRDAIRFANIYTFDLNTIQDEVDYGDFFLVELLKMKYPSVYNILQFRDNRHAILDTKTVNKRNIYKLLPKGFDDLKERNKKIFDLLNHNTIDNIYKLINELFNEVEKVQLNSIRFVDNYYKYFNLSVSPKDIKRKEFLNVLDYSFEEAKQTIDKWFKEKNKGSLNILFYNYSLSDFEHFGQIQNYIYGIKKTLFSIDIRNAVTNFHVALNNGGFFREGLRDFLKSESENQLDELITNLLFPEGIMDVFNGIFIEQLFQEGEEGNNLYSKVKSKELVFQRFYRKIKDMTSFILLLDTWEVIISGKDYNKKDDDILNLTNQFAYYIVINKNILKHEIAILYNRDKEADIIDQNNDVKIYRKDFDVIKNIIEIITSEYKYSSNDSETVGQYDDKRERIALFRQLCLDLLIPYLRMVEFIENLRIIPKDYEEYESYESKILKYYPIKKEKFGQFDQNVFNLLKKEYLDYWQKKLKT